MLDHAGAKGLTADTLRTSADAADQITPTRAHLQGLALRALARLGTATPLEIVTATGRTREAIQPRLSELLRAGLIEPTGQRKQNPSGRTANVLRLTAAGVGEAARWGT